MTAFIEFSDLRQSQADTEQQNYAFLCSTLSPLLTVKEITEEVLSVSIVMGEPLSSARAKRMAFNYKKNALRALENKTELSGEHLRQLLVQLDPHLVRVIQYSDKTGEKAVSNVLREKIAQKKKQPTSLATQATSSKNHYSTSYQRS